MVPSVTDGAEGIVNPAMLRFVCAIKHIGDIPLLDTLIVCMLTAAAVTQQPAAAANPSHVLRHCPRRPAEHAVGGRGAPVSKVVRARGKCARFVTDARHAHMAFLLRFLQSPMHPLNITGAAAAPLHR